ncbi:YceD family protein [Bacillus smithii]|uniref:YceD family protein n=1 Tax=Bacillus smithii TaxID=1479 RepID=UPI002FDA501E
MIFLKWSIAQLRKNRDDFIIDETVEIPELKQMDEQIRDLSPVHITGRADISSEKVTFHLHITGQFILPCARTLEDVPYPFVINSTEIYVLKEWPGQDWEDEDVHKVQGDTLDLLPVIKEMLLAEVPLQVISEDAKKKELPSGKDWKLLTEDQLLQEESEKIDPRLAKLADLFADDK